MTWYVAHAIVSTKKVNYDGGPILFYENMILIEALDKDEAYQKAHKYAEASIAKDDTLTLNDSPAVDSFVGIRKLISVSNPWPLNQDGDRPVDGTEVSYSKFEVRNEKALNKLAKGDPVNISYLE